MKKIYVAGPMRGLPEFNFPSFFAAEKMLEEDGWTVLSPARHDVEIYGEDIYRGRSGNVDDIAGFFDLRSALKWDMAAICGCDAIYLLRGWEISRGAFAEWTLAKALELEFHYE